MQRLQRVLPRGLVGLLLVGLLVAAPGGSARAQSADPPTYSAVLRDVPLDEALGKLAGAMEVNLVYETHLVRDVRVFCVERDAVPDVLLQCVLKGTGLDYYKTSSGTYVLTRAAKEVPRSGRLAGVVVDRATGTPLPYANVRLVDAGVGLATNEAGLFSFSALAPGPYRVVVTYVGYEPAVDSVWVEPGSQVRIGRIALNARSVDMEPIVVTGLQRRMPSGMLGRPELTEEELSAEMNGFGTADVARSTGSLLGVSLQEPLANLHLQGGAPGELQTELDGMHVRSPVTLGQLLGAFSPLAIERLTVYKAGFGAAQGSHLAGRIAAEHALQDAGHQYLVAQFDPLSVNGRGQVNWEGSGGMQASAMVAARSSMWDLYRDPTLSHLLQDWHVVDPLLAPASSGTMSPEAIRHRSDVAFSDVHAAARLQLNPFQTIRASLYRGRNEVESEALMEEASAGTASLRTRDSYHWKSRSEQLRYEGLIGDRLLSRASLYRSRQALGHGYLMQAAVPEASPDGEGGPYDGNWINEVGAKAGLDYNLATRHHVSAALELTRTESRALISNDFFRRLRYAGTQWRFSGFVQDEVSVGLHTHLEAGTRLTYVPDRQTVYAEPRLALRYDGAHRLVGEYALRLAGGLYRQFVNQFDVSSTGPMGLLPSLRFWLPVSSVLAPPRAYHLAADALFRPGAGWQVDLEGYYKWQPRLLALDYPALLRSDSESYEPIAQDAFIASTRGRAFGGSLKVQYRSRRLESSASYSYSRSERRFPGRFGKHLQPTPWEQPHRLALTSSFAFTSSLVVHVDGRGVWRRSWGFRRAYYDYLAPQSASADYGTFDLSDPSRQTLPPLYQVDLGLSYEHRWQGVSVRVRAELLNVFDRRNTFDWSLREVGGRYERLARTLPGRHPALSLRIGY